MSTEPSAATPDTKPSADSAEFEDFFEQGARAVQDDGGVRVEQQQQAEDFDVPLITPEQLARRQRLRRAVGLLVGGLAVAFLVLFANQGVKGSDPALSGDPVAKEEPAQVPVQAVATSLGAARPQPPAPLSTSTSAPEPAAREVLASPAAPPPAVVVTPVVHRASAAHAPVPVPAAESPRRVAAALGSPPRAASAPARGALPARSSRAAEPPATASFPVDPQ